MVSRDFVASLFWKSASSRRRDDVVSEDNDSETSTSDYGMVDMPLDVFLCGQRHRAFDGTPISASTSNSNGSVCRWRELDKERVKTTHVALVLCLHFGVDLRSSLEIASSVRMECWLDQLSMTPRDAARSIAQNLQIQYRNWEPKARYEVLCDPTASGVLTICSQLRNHAKSQRVLFHYNGHGVQKPSTDGEIWVFDERRSRHVPLKVSIISEYLKTPSVYIFDCSAAGIVANALVELHHSVASSSSGDEAAKDCIVLAACESYETLPHSDDLPADVFTSCLTTPIKTALRWLCKHSLFRDSLECSLIDRIPGKQSDRRTMLGELNSILTAITDTIAWKVLPRDLFRRLFRQDALVASLFRNFLLAERVLRSLGCSPVSFPVLPPTYQDRMWDAWDMAAELHLSQLPLLVLDPNASHQSSPFFSEQLRAFEVWLDCESDHKRNSNTLPIVLQALFGQRYRLQALDLLARFLDKGSWAVEQALYVGVFQYILKMLRIRTMERNHNLISICAKILAFDKSLQADLVKHEGHEFFIKFVIDEEADREHRAMAAYVLAKIMDGHRRGQEVCQEAGLLHMCLKNVAALISVKEQGELLFRKWLILCMGKLWEDFAVVQSVALRENAVTILAPLLSAPEPEMRASAVFAMGNLLDVGSNDHKGSVDNYDDDEKNQVEINVVRSVLGKIGDGSPLVRAEVAVVFTRIAFGHNDEIKLTAVSLWNSQFNSKPEGIRSYPLVVRYGKTASSCPIRTPGTMHGSSLSDSSSLNSDSGILDDEFNNEVVHRTRPMPLPTELYRKSVAAISTLSCDPFPYVASLGRRALLIIGVEQAVSRPISRLTDKITTFYRSQSLTEVGTSTSWLDMNAYAANSTISTRSNSSSQFFPSGMHRSLLTHSPDLGLANLLLGPGGLYQRSFLPKSTIYSWSCDSFSKPMQDDDEQIIRTAEERRRRALELIETCRRSSEKCGSLVARWDTNFKSGTEAALLQPFSPVVVAADGDQQIRVWNYEEFTLLNGFDNHSLASRGVSKLLLMNEFQSDLLLVASRDGSIRIWKDYAMMGKQKLVTAFSSIQGDSHGVQNLRNAVFDWQPRSGMLYASGETSSIMVWNLESEQIVNRIPSNCSVSALSASYVHSGQFATGFLDGSVNLYDTRATKPLVCSIQSLNNRVTGVGFEPGLGPIKIVNASHLGEIQFLDARNPREPYCRIATRQGLLTALDVHRHTPIIASGSAEQMIQTFDFDGKELSTIQNSIGPLKDSPVNCLTFHPYQALLTAGASDSIVSIYATDSSQTR